MASSLSASSPPPEAVLIADRRTSLELSVRAAARELAKYTDQPFSNTTWSNIEKGAARATDKQLVAMAQVVRAVPEQLDRAGRPQAARKLAEAIEAWAQKRLAEQARTITHQDIVEKLWRAEQEIRGLPGSAREHEQMFQALLQFTGAAVDAQLTQIRLAHKRPPVATDPGENPAGP
ncbi:hypothetical protein [Bailinhaonella thermotolerans]|uniref:Uncharacterized protein n=1 Tax=Bailinhaonella thermotolerans TaxID=1070861 RepID=A0A3A4AP84_9ACTN|nr:hypothetical protein [Bailinhaonella thermotolerans]RJL21075.1 hypothetical protein D5H75_38325 [Bailinhaonella thermotolerans]